MAQADLINDYTDLESVFENRMAPLDTREIWEYIAEEGSLPNCYAVPGPFDVSPVPFVKEVLRSLRHPLNRVTTAMASVQSLKTLIGEFWLTWIPANAPGPTQWVQPDDQEAKEHAEERFNQLLKNFPDVQRYFSENRHDRKTTAIMFQHMWMRFEGANNLGNAQRKSVKNQMCSEVWQSKKWKPGTLKEFGDRLTQFTFDSKRYIESQPGMIAALKEDDMHATYLEGTQEVWEVACQQCGFYQPMEWSVIRPDGSRAGMRWDTNERTKRNTNSADINQIWNWSELEPTIRWECVKCGHGHKDDPITRRKLCDSGRYRSQIGSSSIVNRSFRWNQLTVTNLNWFATQRGGVKNFLIANDEAKKGHDKPQREFFQKVLAEPYDPDKFAHFANLETIEVNTGNEAGKELEYEGITFKHWMMGVDVQAASWWALVEVWSDAGDSLTMWGGELFTWDEVAEKQQEFGVPDQNVMIDQSHRDHEVTIECTRHGHWEEKDGKRHWLSWKALRGADQDSFNYMPKRGPMKGKRIPLPYTWPPAMGDPCLGLRRDDPRRKEFQRKYCPIFRWSNPTIKDVAISRRDGNADGIKSLVMKGEWNDEFSKQMHSQKKVYAEGRYSGKWKWEKFRDDHLLDCKCEIIVRAFQLHLLGAGVAV